MSETSAAPAETSRGNEIHLRSGVLSRFEILGQSVAEIAPSAVIGLILGLVVATTGAGSWLTWLLATLVVIIVAALIFFLTRRFATTGGLYTLVSHTSGRSPGFFVTAGVFGSIGVAILALPLQFAIFATIYLQLPLFGLGNSRVILAVTGIIAVSIATALVYGGVKLSARLTLILEFVSIAAILILMFVVLATHPGGVFDSSELKLTGVSGHGLLLSSGLVLLSFAGFEMGSVFGQEAKDARRSISWMVFSAVAIVGLLFVFCTYVMYLGFDGTKYSFATSSNPLSQLTVIAGFSWYRYIVGLGVVISMFSVLMANLNYYSRVLYTLGRQGIMPKFFATVNPRTRTPGNGILALGGVILVPLLIVAIWNFNPLNTFDYMGSLSGWLYGVAYFITALAVSVYVARATRDRMLHPLTRWALTIGGPIAAVALGYVIYTVFHPFPAFPLSAYVIIFAVILGIMVIGYFALRSSHKGVEIMDRLGSTVAEDTGADIEARSSA